MIILGSTAIFVPLDGAPLGQEETVGITALFVLILSMEQAVVLDAQLKSSDIARSTQRDGHQSA